MRHDVHPDRKIPGMSEDSRELTVWNLTEYYLFNEIFLCFSLSWKILCKHKVKQIIELAKTLLIICLKDIFRGMFFLQC